jgi:DNA repair exonuclease SbcCD ATPase subunit
VTKFALPALMLLIFGLFYFSVTSQPPDAPAELAGPRTELPQNLANVEKAQQDRVQELAKAIDSIRAELKRLSDDAKANSDKIAQTAALRSDLQDSKSSNDKTAQSMVDQIDALRSDHAQFLQAARETNDKMAQALRQEVAASQAKLLAQVGDTLKINAGRSEALTQRVDALKKEIDEVKKDVDEDRQNISNISPGLALVVALAALVLGPFVARQLTANQIAAAKKQAASEATAAAARSQVAKTQETEPPLAPSAVAELPQDRTLRHEAPPLSEEVRPDPDVNTHQKSATDSEKV